MHLIRLSSSAPRFSLPSLLAFQSYSSGMLSVLCLSLTLYTPPKLYIAIFYSLCFVNVSKRDEVVLRLVCIIQGSESRNPICSESINLGN